MPKSPIPRYNGINKGGSMTMKITLGLFLVSVLASLPLCAAAQQARTNATSATSTTTSAGSIFQSQIGGASASPSAGPRLPAVPTFNAVNSAPTRSILTPGGGIRGAGVSTNIVCDFTDFSGAFGDTVDVCQ
jgi:hypothetical protein